MLFSFETTVATIVMILVISIPAAFEIVRQIFPGKSFLLSTLNLSLYTPAVVMGVSLVIAFAFLFRIPQTITWCDCRLRGWNVSAHAGADHRRAARLAWRLFEEAARTLGATRMQTFWRVELPLLGPGISAGILLDVRHHLQ